MTRDDLARNLVNSAILRDDDASILMICAADEIEAMQKQIEELTTWISFDDHYPETGVQVLVRDTQGAVTTGYRVEVTDDVGKADGIVTDCTLSGDLVAWRAI